MNLEDGARTKNVQHQIITNSCNEPFGRELLRISSCLARSRFWVISFFLFLAWNYLVLSFCSGDKWFVSWQPCTFRFNASLRRLLRSRCRCFETQHIAWMWWDMKWRNVIPHCTREMKEQLQNEEETGDQQCLIVMFCRIPWRGEGEIYWDQLPKWAELHAWHITRNLLGKWSSSQFSKCFSGRSQLCWIPTDPVWIEDGKKTFYDIGIIYEKSMINLWEFIIVYALERMVSLESVRWISNGISIFPSFFLFCSSISLGLSSWKKSSMRWQHFILTSTVCAARGFVKVPTLHVR